MIIDFLLDDIRKAIAGLEAASFADVEYDSSAHTIDFYNVDGESVGSIDASDFIVDGMLDSVTLSGSTLHFVFNTDSGKEAIDVDLSTIIPDIDQLAPVAELPASAETGTVVALYQEGEGGGGTWEGPANNHYTFNCDFSKLDTAQTYDIAYLGDEDGMNERGDIYLKYMNGVWNLYAQGYNVADERIPIEFVLPLTPVTGAPAYWMGFKELCFGDECEEFYEFNAPIIVWDGQNIMAGEWNPSNQTWNDITNFQRFLGVEEDGFRLSNIEGGSQTVMGVYQYDGTEWVPVGGGNIDELVEMLQAKEEVIASAITELHESIPDLSDYWTSGETKSYVDGAVGALATELASVEDDLNDIERVTATALTELHDSILDLSGATADFVTSGDVETLISAATDDFVTTADTQEIIDRLQIVENVASAAFDHLETMMETKEEVIAEALTDLEDTKVGSEDIKRIVKLTQAEYDLIATPDPETLYIIVNA